VDSHNHFIATAAAYIGGLTREHALSLAVATLTAVLGYVGYSLFEEVRELHRDQINAVEARVLHDVLEEREITELRMNQIEVIRRLAVVEAQQKDTTNERCSK